MHPPSFHFFSSPSFYFVSLFSYLCQKYFLKKNSCILSKKWFYWPFLLPFYWRKWEIPFISCFFMKKSSDSSTMCVQLDVDSLILVCVPNITIIFTVLHVWWVASYTYSYASLTFFVIYQWSTIDSLIHVISRWKRSRHSLGVVWPKYHSRERQ